MWSALRLSLLLLACTFAAPAQADSWAAPQVREVFSASRDHFVRVIPGTSVGETAGFAGAGKGGYATAEYYRRQADRSYKLMQSVTLLNPVAPVDIFVSGDGRLVTVDNWHNRGYGKVLALYDAAGRLVKAYELTDLFLKAEIDAYPHSVSSRAWHNGPVYLNRDQRTLYMMIAGATWCWGSRPAASPIARLGTANISAATATGSGSGFLMQRRCPTAELGVAPSDRRDPRWLSSCSSCRCRDCIGSRSRRPWFRSFPFEYSLLSGSGQTPYGLRTIVRNQEENSDVRR